MKMSTLKKEKAVLEAKVKKLEKTVTDLNRKNSKLLDVGLSDHVGCRQLLDYSMRDEVFEVYSKICYKMFRIDSRFLTPGVTHIDEIKYTATLAEREVQDLFTKEAFQWLMETQNPKTIGGFDFYYSTKIPENAVFVHPSNVSRFARDYIENFRQYVNCENGDEKQ